MKTVKTNVRLPDEAVKISKKLASLKGLTYSQYVSQLVSVSVASFLSGQRDLAEGLNELGVMLEEELADKGEG